MLTSFILAAASPSAALGAYAADQLKVAQFRWAEADLDGDGRPEQFIYAGGPDWCGSGGCTLFVLSPRGNGYRLVLRASVSRPPIGVLPSRSHGWRDIGVAVGGGGNASGQVRLRFDGRRYRPGKPTVARISPHSPRMRVLITE